MAEQYFMTQEELHRVQEIEMELIQEVDRICKKCDIHYTMIGGTMLGAIRHKGFIPWDDDVDIAMLRKEYEKFRNACKTELNHEKYYFHDIKGSDGYRWGYGKLRKKGTKFVRYGQEFMPYEQGIFIDLMPLDNVPDNKLFRKIHFINCFLLQKFLWAGVGYKTEKNKGLKFLYSLMQLVPLPTLVKWYEILGNISSHHKTELVRNLTLRTPKGTYGFKREWYVKQRKYQFGPLFLTGAKDYDAYLTHKYGNYMDVPPEEERKLHPISQLQLGD